VVFRLNKTEKRHRLNGHGGAGYPFDPSQPGTWDAVETRRYVWDGYNIAAEIVIDEVTPSTNVTYYTWGLDLSGTLQGAGGVGGLLAVTTADLDQPDSLTTYYPCYDANGNITEYVDGSGNIRAHYEYSPFGEIVVQSGDLADTFTHRFSTKPFDAETSLVMYQLRPYAPGLGRWLKRDPIAEFGGINLYLTSGNNCIANYDRLGLSFVDWLPFAGTLKTMIENVAKSIPGQDADNYPASVSFRRCCEVGHGIAETECEQFNNYMYFRYSMDFSVDAFKGKVLEVVAVVIIKNPAISLAALVDGLTAGINWIDVLNDMRKARDTANAQNCDCSKTGYIPQGM
jgi:RHS repeat-associated protein